MSVHSVRPLARLRRPAAVVAALAAVLLAAAPAAQARSGSGEGGDGGWQPYRNTPKDYPAGALCPFHLHIGIVTDEEETRTAASYPDGSPSKVLFRGPLVLRYTNVDSGRSVDRDQSGRATLYYLPDGSRLWLVPRSSHISARIFAGNPYHAPGDFVFSGGVTLLIHPDGQPQVLEQHQVENLCETLT
ncbi:hypothetical protein F7Q99_26765 [Streptomyces kaniharaensis]|uniref:Uncharacterized protein n=1 Tax=Streptomyces kaniharaensis TaxID=212423 RepID=A0A6N7KW69_9ACTN|nr:hypothetical protein [Streptomyces kaniharaensis]MQS15770.1 hypothetical protein [Streptomyces kaniharaensis]